MRVSRVTMAETTADECRYLAAWAERFGARFESAGECGFGRPCVGIVLGNEYPAYTDHEYLDSPPYARQIHDCPEAAPPREVTDAYHKHDCLAVLGRGPGAIHQLYLWVRNLEREGVGVEVRERRGRPVDLLFHGPTVALLVKLEAEGAPNASYAIDMETLRRGGPGFEAPGASRPRSDRRPPA